MVNVHCNFLYHLVEQFLIELIHLFRPLMKCFHSLTQGIRHFADVIISQQSPPFGPELGQLCVQGGQLGGTGVRIQQTAGAEFADLIVLFGSLGDGRWPD